MLLRGKVFVPTIAELRYGDPIEAKSPCVKTKTYFDDLPPEDREWLHTRATDSERRFLEHENLDGSQRSMILMQIWDRELAKRRTIWCWHAADIESMSLWDIYAREGVAIRSTPSRIRESFSPYFVDSALIAEVEYVDQASSNPPPDCHFMRPYLIKRRCYRHEREVRAIFPRNSDDPNGHRLLPIDPRKLISEVRISPHLPRSEAAEIRQSLAYLWNVDIDECDAQDEVAVFVSDSKTVYESFWDSFKLNQTDQTGITNFGSLKMPFVMCGDFRKEG